MSKSGNAPDTTAHAKVTGLVVGQNSFCAGLQPRKPRRRDRLKPVCRLKSAPPRSGHFHPHRWPAGPSRLPDGRGSVPDRSRDREGAVDIDGVRSRPDFRRSGGHQTWGRSLTLVPLCRLWLSLTGCGSQIMQNRSGSGVCRAYVAGWPNGVTVKLAVRTQRAGSPEGPVLRLAPAWPRCRRRCARRGRRPVPARLR
jgi:hypothetical protein